MDDRQTAIDDRGMVMVCWTAIDANQTSIDDGRKDGCAAIVRWTAIDGRLMAIYDRRTLIVRWRRAIYDRWTPIEGMKRLSCQLDRQCLYRIHI